MTMSMTKSLFFSLIILRRTSFENFELIWNFNAHFVEIATYKLTDINQIANNTEYKYITVFMPCAS